MSNNIQLKEFLLQQWLRGERRNGQIKDLATSCSSTSSMARPSSTVQAPVTVSNKRKRKTGIEVKLAEENVPSAAEQSDSSMYDSFNEHETDVVRDSSDCDSDGYVTEGIATVDVLEYEVDDSSESEDLYTHGSSSGTEDLFMAAVVTKALFDPTSSSSDQFEMMDDDADTEESNAPTDPELRRADYWTCIKCKNKNNNPIYRYCEKCYQIRKTHFPPRPKHRKKRSQTSSKGANSHGSKSQCSSSSAASSSAEETKGDSPKKGLNRSSELSKSVATNSNANSNGMGKFLENSLSSTKKATIRRTASGNSAGESSCSSQELSPDEQRLTSKDRHSNYNLNVCASNQEIYCSQLETIVNSKTNFNYLMNQDSLFPTSDDYSSQLSASQTIATDCTPTSSSGIDGCSIAKTGSLSSGDFTSELSPDERTGIDVDQQSADKFSNSQNPSESHQSTMVTTSVKKRKAKKRKISKSDVLTDSDDDDNIITAAKKAKATRETTIYNDDTDSSNGMCIICLTQPKNSAFVHNRFLHVCCCYRCAVKVWNKRKRCPICNSQVKTVLKMFVH